MTRGLWILTGPPGSGKTTVLDELRSDIECVEEPARRVLAKQRAAAGSDTPAQDPARFVELLLEVAIADHERASLGRGPVLFDRGIPDCIAYALHLGVASGSSILAAQRYRYEPEVVILEPWGEIYVTDDERTMSFAQTLAFHSVLVHAYEQAGYQLIVVPRASPKHRAGFVRDRILSPGRTADVTDRRQARRHE